MAYCHLIEFLDSVGDSAAKTGSIHSKRTDLVDFGSNEDIHDNIKKKGTSGNNLTRSRRQGFPTREHYPIEYSGEKRAGDAKESHAHVKKPSAIHRTPTTVCGSQHRGKRFINRETPQSLKFLLLILMMGSLPGIDPSVLSHTICKYFEYKERCENELLEAEKTLNESKIYCSGEFDNYMCWPHTEAGRMGTTPCPDFYHDVNGTSSGFRYCQPNGSWYQQWDESDQKHVTWRHIDECIFFGDNDTDYLDFDESETTLLSNLKTMYTIGYGISLVCLVIALFLLTFFKKLHCTRNYIHMNLMVSFILRYVVVLVKDSVLTSHYKLDGLADVTVDPNRDALRQYCDEDNSTGWVLTRCRLVITLMHYAITANYFWLLAEGLYLQMLLVFVIPENKYFPGFVVFGWGAPWVSVLIWVALRMNYENSGCWDMNDEMPIWWTIRAPIIISIVINFFIFINIIRLIVSKLNAHNMARSDMKMRLAKSTLALIPLLGIHYIVFLALTEEVTDTNATPMHLRLAFDMFLSSIQGTLVSVLYCFLNNEVRCEVKRAWDLWRSHRALPSGSSHLRKSSTTVSGNHSTQMTQFYSRHSTTGGDIALQETLTRTPNSSGPDSRANSIVARNSLSNGDVRSLMNGNGVSEGSWKNHMNGSVVKAENNNTNTTSLTTYAAKKNDTNGNVECKDDVPFLGGHAV